MSAIQIHRALASASTPVHSKKCPQFRFTGRSDPFQHRSTGKKMSAIQLQRARGSTSTLIHENACALLSYNGRADQRRRRSTRMPVRYSATMGARINVDAGPRECLYATQLQWARGSTSTPVHENACPLLSYNGREDHLRRRSTRMPVRYSATMGARIIFDADPRECLSATQLQWARGSSSTPIHENACPLLSYNGRGDQRRRRSTQMSVQQK